MSFSVRAGSSSPPSAPLSGSSLLHHTFISPHMLPQGVLTHMPPPFTLAGTTAMSVAVDEQQQQQQQQQQQHLPHGKRVGTDPSKYKTTMCRNWEQTGMCNFRGCTFAHGIEELRAPARVDRHTPRMHPQAAPPSHATPHSNSIGAHALAGGNGSLVNSAAASTTSPMLAAAGGGAGGMSAGSMTTTPMGTHIAGVGCGGGGGGAVGMGAVSPLRLEQLLELLYAEVMRERELVAMHVDANRKLEAMLHREQAQHEETRLLLEEKQRQYAALVELVTQQNHTLARATVAGELAMSQTHMDELMLHTTTAAAAAGASGIASNSSNNNNNLLASVEGVGGSDGSNASSSGSSSSSKSNSNTNNGVNSNNNSVTTTTAAASVAGGLVTVPEMAATTEHDTVKQADGDDNDDNEDAQIQKLLRALQS